MLKLNYGKVLVKIEQEENVTGSGILLSVTNKKLAKAEVVQTARWAITQFGQVEMDLDVGDRITLKNGTNPQTFDEKENLYIVDFFDILLSERGN